MSRAVERAAKREPHERRVRARVLRGRGLGAAHLRARRIARVGGDERGGEVLDPLPHQAVKVADAPRVRRAADIGQHGRCRARVPREDLRLKRRVVRSRRDGARRRLPRAPTRPRAATGHRATRNTRAPRTSSRGRPAPTVKRWSRSRRYSASAKIGLIARRATTRARRRRTSRTSAFVTGSRSSQNAGTASARSAR